MFLGVCMLIAHIPDDVAEEYGDTVSGLWLHLQSWSALNTLYTFRWAISQQRAWAEQAFHKTHQTAMYTQYKHETRQVYLSISKQTENTCPTQRATTAGISACARTSHFFSCSFTYRSERLHSADKLLLRAAMEHTDELRWHWWHLKVCLTRYNRRTLRPERRALAMCLGNTCARGSGRVQELQDVKAYRRIINFNGSNDYKEIQEKAMN